MTPEVQITNDRLQIEFCAPFDIEAYKLFLKCKKLPEHRLRYSEELDTYTIDTPARFASILGLEAPQSGGSGLAIPEFHFEHQREIVKLGLDAKRFAVWSDCGTGKALRTDMPVLTESGWCEIGKLVVGEQVYGTDGELHRVLGVFPQGRRQMYRVTFSDGAEVYCDADHLWSVQTQLQRYRGRKGRTLTLRDIMAEGLKDATGRRRHFVPIAAPLQRPSALLPIDPYTLGVLLGDGGMSQSAVAVTTDAEIAHRLILPEGIRAKQIDAITADVATFGLTGKRSGGHTPNPLVGYLRALGLQEKKAEVKFIPREYLFASIPQRFALLQGLLDTDGYIDRNNHIEFYTSSKQLIEDVRFLIESLGGLAPISVKTEPKYSHKGETRTGLPAYRLTVQLPASFGCPFRLTRKAERWKAEKHYHPARAIDRIQEAGESEAVCIKVDTLDHLFLTADLVATHNTNIELEFARQVVSLTGRRVLIITLNEIVDQTIDEARKFYGDSLQLHRIETRQELREWCKAGPGQIAITNYEKMNPDDHGQIVNEMRHLGGLILDESSRLKAGGGKQKWALIHSSKGIPYKLSCTATPAPNDVIEFASQASFLERMRNDNEIIWTFFARDPETQEWTVKRHARAAFFEWMAAWSIYLRDPRRYGWSSEIELPPEPEMIYHKIDMTPAQVEAMKQHNTDRDGQIGLFASKPQGIVVRGKFSQIAKGFIYRDDGKADRIESLKPGVVAGWIIAEYHRDLNPLIWTVFDEESEIIAEHLRAKNFTRFAVLSGSTPKGKRQAILDAYRRGETPVLISKASLLGYGMNFQHCGSMIFSGWTDSFEAIYQAIRRAVRYGQKRRVRVHFPYIEELEGPQLDNIFRKARQFEEIITEQETAYISAMRRLNLLKEAA